MHWSIKRKGIVDACPQGEHHCGYIGHPAFKWKVTMKWATQLDEHGWIMDNNVIQSLVNMVVHDNPTRSCEELAELIFWRLKKRCPSLFIKVTMGDSNGITKISYEGAHVYDHPTSAPQDRQPPARSC